ncbi:unnamed protein product [Staurois parvus]|uniref:Uncharacterized protein n=1 Tax=Staurois parvus TaxID=386267 RepID=A0ABN9BK42_9NEOB|nr:unnamed protein product [Staurois parvus]
MPTSDFCVPVPVTSRCTGRRREIFLNFKKNFTLLFQPISHTFCPEFFVLCPACILTVFCLETEKSPWRPKSVPVGQKRF